MRSLAMAAAWSGNDAAETIADVKLADDSGVDSVWVTENWGQDPFTLLSLLAYETKRIKLATGIVHIYARSPAVLAQHVATLDQLSGGRVILGLGPSGPRVVEHFHGVKFEKPLTRMREYVDIINLLLRGDKLVYDGAI